MITKKTWTEFHQTGLLLFVNHFLHIFGWALVMEIPDSKKDEGSNNGELIRVYPARCKFRGFDEKSENEAFRKLSTYLVNNAAELQKEVEEDVRVKSNNQQPTCSECTWFRNDGRLVGGKCAADGNLDSTKVWLSPKCRQSFRFEPKKRV